MKIITPGATIGVLGSGQLGRMFAIAARRMGYRVHTFSPETDTPTGQVADMERTASYDDLAAVQDFARRVNVVTFEFENVSKAAVEAAAKHAPVHPSGDVLYVTQHRLREKTFLSQKGFAVTPFEAVKTADELKQAVKRLGIPCVLKTAGFGYDGKGQMKIAAQKNVAEAAKRLNGQEMILEGFVDFEKELSVVAARGEDGSFAHFGVMENTHVNHILDITFSPADISPALTKEAIEMARGILKSLNVVGVMCVEMFLTKKGTLLVNELAPRPHNSGHLTFDACVTSQFEQQLRAVCALPLGSTELLRPAAMANLLGDIWKRGEPRWDRALKDPLVKLHLYGKSDPRPGRKMGHLTAFGATVKEAVKRVHVARAAL
jgi:5-(carboxyamino)imidazole ribonucleotide synthase